MIDDIGHRIEAQDALSDSGDTLRAFYDNSPALMGVDEPTSDGDILHLYDNGLTCALFGPGRAGTAS